MEEKSKEEICPIRDVISRLSDKWSLLVIITLSKRGKVRFNVIQKELEDISQRMLTVTLRSLEADGLVEREIFAEIPPRVEYQLTPLGQSLLPPLRELVNWALKNRDSIMNTRKRFGIK